MKARQGAGDVGAVGETIHRLKAGHLLNLYSEGARTSGGEIGPLQRGVGLIVRRAGVPVVTRAVIQVVTGTGRPICVTHRACDASADQKVLCAA